MVPPNAEKDTPNACFPLLNSHPMYQVKKYIPEIILYRNWTAPLGKTRVTVAEDDGKYITVGLKPNRGRKGISESWPKKLSNVDKKKICKLISTCQDVAKGYVPANELRGLQFAKMMAQWPNLKGVSSQQIWGSLACGKNYYLNTHLDEDFFIP
jgi:hypothetical protein